MKNSTLVIRNITLMLVLLLSGLVSQVWAQSGPQWVKKAEKAGITISVALDACHGSSVLLYRVENKTNTRQEISYAINYSQGAVVINDTKTAILSAQNTRTPSCDDAAVGLTDSFSLVPNNASVDLSKVSITIQ